MCRYACWLVAKLTFPEDGGSKLIRNVAGHLRHIQEGGTLVQFDLFPIEASFCCAHFCQIT
jgi:hypothetical protein